MGITIRWARVLDLAERTGATYLQAFCGLLLADQSNLLNLAADRAAAIAALPAALAAIKSAFALGLGSSGTASLLPAKADPASTTPSATASTTPGA